MPGRRMQLPPGPEHVVGRRVCGVGMMRYPISQFLCDQDEFLGSCSF